MSDTSLTDLRDITEENDLDCILKPNIGGYTKKSVLEYLAYIKKQQYDMRENFSSELMRIQNEKEVLQAENERITSEKNSLQKEYETLDADLGEALTRISKDEDELEKLRGDLISERSKAAASAQNADEFRSLLDAACAKNDELNEAIADIDTTTVRLRTPEEFAAEIPGVDETSRASARLTELIQDAERLKAEMSAKTEELSSGMRELGELTKTQLEVSRSAFIRLNTEFRSSLDQNELLESEKDGLSQRVSELLEQNVALGRENSRLKAANLILIRQLEGK